MSTTERLPADQLDVLVIGGGAAGLSAAIALARFDRSVEVVDAGAPRNAPSPGVHNLLGHDGIDPADLLARGQAELRSFGGAITHDTAVAATRTEDGFAVRLASGDERTARLLIVTTGLRDRLPEVRGLAARWGHDVIHCPYCHGWEVRGQTIGVLATNAMAVHQAQLFRELSDDVVVFAHTAPAFDDDQREVLAALDIPVVDGEVSEVVVRDSRLAAVRLTDGRTIERQALVVASDLETDCPVLDDLGVGPAEDGRGGYAHDATGATGVPGVWVAGNVADPFATVAVASAAGLTAASMANFDLIAERVRAAVEARRADATASR